MSQTRTCLVLAALLGGAAGTAHAQTFESVGTRAAGMAGAFTAVADDASAAYWNPAGLASGNLFSMVLDRTTVKVDPAGADSARQTSGLLVAIGMPALALSYYRLEHTRITPVFQPTADPSAGRQPGAGNLIRLDRLITNHTGATVVQSLAAGIALGATFKVVRGVAASGVLPDQDRASLLSSDSELMGKSSSKFDVDVGVMATSGRLKAGLTLRDVTQPEFGTADGSEPFRLRRQVRAGLAWTPIDGWAVSVGQDLTRNQNETEAVRSFAAGTEGRISKKAFVRSGFRVNTAGPRRASVAAGASYAVLGPLFVDAQATFGSDTAARGWGVAARLLY